MGYDSMLNDNFSSLSTKILVKVFSEITNVCENMSRVWRQVFLHTNVW